MHLLHLHRSLSSPRYYALICQIIRERFTLGTKCWGSLCSKPMYLIIVSTTLGARGFSCAWREFSVLAEGRSHERRKTFRAVHYKELAETENRARKVSGTQGVSTY